jgi:RHS repeat-associated protein
VSLAHFNIWFNGVDVIGNAANPYTSPVTDRLGTDRSAGARFAPYGAEVTSTSNDRTKFGTYTRDLATGLNYAQNRYYDSARGRFTSADPYQGSASQKNPSSWNRYSYTMGDPVNHNDPSGMNEFYDGGWDGGGGGGGFGGFGYYGGGGSNSCIDAFGDPSICFGYSPIYDPPEYPSEWDSLDPPCQQALQTAMPNSTVPAMMAALNRAWADTPVFDAAAAGTAINGFTLGAIAIRESGVRDINQGGGGGGVGVFQIGLTRNPGVTVAQANSLSWAATWAAQYLNSNLVGLLNKIPLATNPGADYLWMDAASYNTGLQGQINRYNNGQSPDYHTAPQGNDLYGNNYGSNILGLANCLEQ